MGRLDIGAVIEAIAATQHGLVTRGQLLARGIHEHAIDGRVKRGRLCAVHRGVYHHGPLHGAYEREMAATLACGGVGFLSHGSAAGLVEQLPRTLDGPVEVIVRNGSRSVGAGIRVHRVPSLADDETTTVEGIPSTVPARTILDLAATARPADLERALAQTYRLKLATAEQIRRMMARHPRRSGLRTLRALLDREGGPAFTRSEAESRFLALVRTSQLPVPEVNARLLRHEVDFLWRTERVVVEVDGYAFHSSRTSFEHDRKRDTQLAAAGCRVLRVTWRQLANEPVALMVRLAQALAASPPRWRGGVEAPQHCRRGRPIV